MNKVSLAQLLHRPPPGESPVAFGSGGVIPWAKFLRDIDGLVGELQRRNEVQWLLCFDDSYFFAVAFFAALYSDRRVVVPGNLQHDAVTELLDEKTGCLHDDILGDITGTHIALPSEWPSSGHPSFPPLEPGSVTLTLLTSGSTGQPKAVIKRLTDLEAEVRGLEHVWGATLRDCRVVSTVSHQHIYGLLFRVLWPLCAGRMFDRKQLAYPEQVVTRADPDAVLVSSPAMLKRVLDKANSAYRAIFSSGGPLTFEAATGACSSLGSLPVEVFGSTETGGIGWRRQEGRDTPWQLFDGIEAGINGEGCLKIHSPYISPAGWYQTSDQCRLLENRQFLLLGRVDRVVKIEEKRVSLPEVEQRLCSLPWVRDAAVLQFGGSTHAVLGAVLTLTPDGLREMESAGRGKFWLALRQELRRWLEPAAVPRMFRVVNEIPVNSQGKRTDRELRKMFPDT